MSQNIRNFCIIAHIDHGKSTLADRFLEVTSTISKREMKHNQILDSMELEQERGITIKLQPVRMDYTYNNEKFILNLIDTPGHVDFSYEVSRSLAACEGAILVVDATQGIEAQTLANCYAAVEQNLEIIPVINKIDLPAANPEVVAAEIEKVLGIKKEEIISISAKEGTNVEKVLERVIEKVPPPKILSNTGEVKALIFDSVYDSYKGVLAYVRVFGGNIKQGDELYFLNTKKKIEVLEIGYFKPKYTKSNSINLGEVGYVVTGLKTIRDARVGDTLWSKGSTDERLENAKSLPGYKEVTPYVFSSIFCVDGQNYPMLKDALEKLSLNDSSFTYEVDQSPALGHGFRCGFLGLLHMDIIRERLEREYDLDLIITAPSVSYKVIKITGEEIKIENPTDLPDPVQIKEILEPWINAEIITPKEYLGNIMKLIQDSRGIYKSYEFIEENRVLIQSELPLAAVIINFYDKLKNISSGYASMNYYFMDYKAGDLVKIKIIILGDEVQSLCTITHRSEAQYLGRIFVKKLKEVIPRAQFEIPIQAAIGSKVIARETIQSFRKDVTAKLYGGDVTRKNKLRDKQKKGKKRMKRIGKVDLPQEAFLAVLKR